MKLKKWLCAALVLLLLTGCGAKSGASEDMDYYNGAAADGIYGESGGNDKVTDVEGSSAAPVNEDQKLIKTVYMDAETEDLDALLRGIESKIAELGGYVEARTVHNGSAYASRRSRYADMTIRIPAADLDGFVTQIQGMSNIVSSNETVEDVTLSYVAVESRMKALEAEEERLLELMEKAETMYDLLEVEKRLTEVRSELESVTSQLRVMDNRVDYATVKLSVEEVRQLTVVEEESVWQRMGRGFMQNLKNLGNGLVEFAVAIVVSLPFLVPLAAIVVVVILLVRQRKRRKKRAKPPFPTQETPPENQE